jgi:hypothetical protein
MGTLGGSICALASDQTASISRPPLSAKSYHESHSRLELKNRNVHKGYFQI